MIDEIKREIELLRVKCHELGYSSFDEAIKDFDQKNNPID